MEDYPGKAASVDLFVERIGKLRSNGIKINENGLKGVLAVLLKNLVPNKAKYNDEHLWLEYEMTARVGCMVFMQQASIYIMEKGELYRQLREMTKTEKGSIYLWKVGPSCSRGARLQQDLQDLLQGDGQDVSLHQGRHSLLYESRSFSRGQQQEG